jgi:NodT family efflux transporter outer membrane factor (OMF) lipoprotein
MQHAHRHATWLVIAAAALCSSGCTSFSEYYHNGFKVGPNYTGSRAAVAPGWIDGSDVRVRAEAADLSQWWSVFNDPTLDDLICHAYNQNINLKDYATRIVQARAQYAIAKGEIFPQTQEATGSYQRVASPSTSQLPGTFKFFDQWNMGFNLAWELDFWGLYRRQVISNKANLDQSIDNYDAVLVTLMGDVTMYYIMMRENQERIELARQNSKLQREILQIVKARFDAGTVTELDVAQQQSTLSQTEAQIPAFEISLRQSQDQLCTLLGIPPTDLQARLGQRPIPTAPNDAVVGIPAQLLERRPDVRAAERAVAAQSEQIGIAQAAEYPHISITGSLGYSALNASQLFTPASFTGSVGPTFTWNILNYGRLVNNVRLQDAKFQQTLLDYRTAVLTADQETEDGLVAFLKSQEQARLLYESVVAADKAFQIVVSQYKVGTVDFNRLATIETNLVTQQDLQAQSRAQIALGLVQVYRSLGGGWEIRLGQQAASNGTRPPAVQPGMENVPIPAPNLNPVPGNGAPGNAGEPVPIPAPPVQK